MDARKTRAPKRKPGAPRVLPRSLPVPFGPSAGSCHWPAYTGHLSRDRVYVRQRDAVLRLYNMGYFGKGTLSKHAPTFHRERTADNFDLSAHLLNVTDKVYLKRTFVGSVAQGCDGPAELVSLRSVAKHPFCTVRPSSSGPSASVASDCGSATYPGTALQNRVSSTGSNLAAAAAAVVAHTDGEDGLLDCTHSSHVPPAMSVHSLTSVGKAAVDEWESMDADVDFWLGSSANAADAGCPGTDGGAASRPPAVELRQESSPATGLGSALEAAAKGNACVNNSSRTCLAVQPCDLQVGADFASVAATSELLQRKDSAAAAVTMVAAPPAAGDHECSPDRPSSGNPVAAELAYAEKTACPEVGNVIGEDGREDRAQPEAVIHEHLELLLEEAFFLAYGLGCLKVMSSSSACPGDVSRSPAVSLAGDRNPSGREPRDSSEASCDRNAACHSQALDLRSLWRTMCSNQPRFMPRYVAYHYLRSKGWVPRDGLRFGVDFVVYKAGPPYYHASYSVVVIPVDDISLSLSSAFTVGRSWTWPSLAGTNRVTENVNKELLLCYVILPGGWSEEQLFSSPDCLQHCHVHLVIMHRLITSKERELEKNASGSP